MIATAIGDPISEELIENYLERLISSFYKILPMRENSEKTLPVYLQSLQIELTGCKQFIIELNNDPGFLTLLSILQYLIDNPNCPVKETKREVFKAIGICNKLKSSLVKA